MHKMWRAVVGAGLVMGGAAQAAPPPASAFGRTPAIVDIEISPNGQRLAIMGGPSEQRFVSIATLDKPGLPILQLGDVNPVFLEWAGDDYVLARVAYRENFGGRDFYRLERTLSVTPDAQVVARLFSDDPLSARLIEHNVIGTTQAPTRVVALGLAEDRNFSISNNTKLPRKGLNTPYVKALWSLDPATGRGELMERGSHDTQGWEIDADGEPRVRLEVDDLSHRFAFSIRKKGDRGWEKQELDDTSSYFGYSVPDQAIYLQVGDKLTTKQLADGASSVIAEGFGGVLPRLIWDRRRKTVVGVETGAERPSVRWLDPEIAAVHTTLSGLFKDRAVVLWSWSVDRNLFVIRASGPASPGAWYLFDRTRKELSPLGEEYPELKENQLATTRWFTYKARDGLEVSAYVTSPASAAVGKAPLIVFPHDGPRSRDVYDFDFLAHFLASRGYVVLQPQYRGSTGFGIAFENAGRGEWGGKMQTDLLDGVAALAATGAVDPDRTCIIGLNFGGYLALAGASLHPEAYQCAASVSGIADIGLLLQERSRLYGRDSANMEAQRALFGGRSSQELAAMSPARQAAKVQAPILLIHGVDDTVIPPEQSETMAKALKAAGKPYEQVVLDGVGEDLVRATVRTQTLEAIDAFLAKHLPVG